MNENGEKDTKQMKRIENVAFFFKLVQCYDGQLKNKSMYVFILNDQIIPLYLYK